MSTARASPLVILVDFLSLPLGVAGNVFEAYPVVGPVANLTDVHVIELEYICFRLKATIVESNFTACALNGRVGYRFRPFR